MPRSARVYPATDEKLPRGQAVFVTFALSALLWVVLIAIVYGLWSLS